MAEIIFDLQLFDGPGGGGTPPGSGGGSSSSSVSWSGATSITSAGTYSNKTYTSTSADENAVLISTTGKVNLSNATVTKSGGTSASDNYSFYGINSAVMCMGGGTTSISGGTVTTSAAGANGIFSYGANNGTTNATGDGTTVYVKNVTINTTGQGSGGIMTTYGGTTVAENLTITTSGGSSAPIRTDRGGGWVTVNGGSYTSSGLGSPAIYSTADVKVNDATLNSELSEGVCIEGTGSIALSNCTLTANNTSTNGNATFLDTIMIYQSQSGDASDGTSQFTMTGGTLNSKSGHVFHVTNTSAIITLENVTINNTDSENILLSVCDDGWSGASNIATLNASNQTLEGDILVGDDSTLTLTLEDSSTFTGNISGNITNASGSSVSTSIGTVNVTLDEDSKWYLTGDTYISSFSGAASNVITGEYTLYVNNVALDGTSTSDDGGKDENSTLISGTSSADSIYNSESSVMISTSGGADTVTNTGDSVIIDAGAGNDSVTNSGDNVSIYGGAGNDYISLLSAAENVTILASMGKDSIEGVNSTTYLQGTFTGSSVSGDNVILTSSNGTLTVVDGAGETLNINGEESVIGGEEEMETLISGTSGADNISNTLSGVMISTGGGADTITNTGDSVTIDSGAGNDIISNSGDNVSIYGNAGADSIKNTGANVTISGGAGNDSITALESENVSINTGGGNNYIFNGYVYYDDDNNFVDHETLAANASSTILAGSGKDTIVNQGIYNASVDAGNGSNSILIYHSYNSTFITGSGADLIDVARGGSLGVYSGAGNDSIIGHLATIQTDDFDNWAFGSYATIDAGAGNDYISLHYSGNSSIFGGAGNDTIINNGENTTINGGAGNDYIEFTNNLREDTGDYEGQVIEVSAGNDTIKNYSSVVTLQGTFTSSSVSGDNVILTSSNGTLTILDGAGETLNINGVESVISADNETIGAAFAEFMLKRTEKGYPALCETGLFEPDTVGSAAPDAYLTENWTIESADNLKLCGVHYGPKNPKGQWVVLVTGYGQVGATMNLPAAVLLAMDYDVLVVEPRSSGNSEGDWLTMGVAECVDVALWTQKIAETNSNAQITLYGISMGAATVMMAAALSKTTNVTSLVEDCGYANIYSIFENLAPYFAESFGWTGTTEELFDKVADATETLTGYNVADAVPLDSISEVTVPSMFIHGTADTLVPVEDAQTLYDASGATIKELWTVEGAGHAKSITKDPLSYLAKAATLIGVANEEIGASIKNSTAEKLIRGTIYNDTIKSSAKNVTIEAVAGDDKISLSSAAKNNTIYAGEGDDSIIGGGGNNLFVYAGGNDYISAYKTTDTIQIASGEITKDTVSGSNVIFTVGEDNITIKSAKNKTIHLIDADGNSFSTIISGVYTEVTITDADKSSVKVDANALLIDASSRTEDLKITGNSKANTILGGSGVDTIYGGSGNDSIIGNDGADKLYGDAGNDSIYGGADDDYINGGAGNDKLYGEDGADSILGASGNDYIEGGAGADSLYGDAGNDSIYGGADADYINGGAGNDRLYGEDGADIILGGAGTDYIEGGAGADSLYGDAGNDSMYGGADADYIDGGAGNDKLFGEAGADIILGGDGNDTLNGGDGNDTLTGGNGNDIFVFEGGNDVITDYTASKDKIKLSAEITNTTYDGDDVIFTIDGDTLTVKDGNGKKISIINSSGKTTTQLYSNANARTLDLFEDNNFMTDDTNLDSITEAKFTVTDIQDNNADTFAQDENILTFAKEK